ncbi:MAG: TIGR03620 family F420-dependent LLM class oxidoreductase [Actinomycetales bacterium]|nr:TIGR03620 family F420-dependent LLM class oxidoreductase [Actinomycetales bacterium]
MSVTLPSPFGLWIRDSELDPSLAVAAERAGFGTLWVGGSPDGSRLEPLLEATEGLQIATGIVNIWTSPAAAIGATTLRLRERFPGRFLLGIGAGHPERADAAAGHPFAAISRYLDELEAAGLPAAEVVIAALGPRMLRLAGERTAGAHPYLTTPEHTRGAREILGAGPLLVPEQRVVLDTDPESARATARAATRTPYLGLRNYRANLERLGFAPEELDEGGSDRLIDALAAWGDDAAIRARVDAHLAAGADQVAVQVLGEQPQAERIAAAGRALGLGEHG